jgi:hypothetical protein
MTKLTRADATDNVSLVKHAKALPHMFRTLTASTVILLALLPAVAFAAPPHKRHVYHWHGYGFLPGYHQPPSNGVPVYGPRGATGPSRQYAPHYWYDGGRYYFGRPGFFEHRYNGGSFGPCYTWTPIGPIWNCG